MKIAQLVQRMKENDVSLPTTGSGRGGKILAADLENALGDYFFKLKYANDPEKAKHCTMRRALTPMKAYRYDKLNEETKASLFEDHNDWIAEEKYNGWRIIITYRPESGFCFWGGNISDVDFLPVDYTEHIIMSGDLHPMDELFHKRIPYICSFDSEALCFDSVETQDGLFSNNTLEAIGAILGSGSERARELQAEGAKIILKCFDYVGINTIDTCTSHYLRKGVLEACLNNFRYLTSTFQLTESHFVNKQQMLRKIWKQGGEGIILKNTKAHYVPNGRLKTHAIKVKRTMSGEIGDDIDVFISGFILTPEHTKKELIGGIKLSIFIEDGAERKQHILAVVTNMPDEIRKRLTTVNCGALELHERHYNRVLVVDGQELSNRHRKLMHSKIDWARGFRQDKSWRDCIIELAEIEETRF